MITHVTTPLIVILRPCELRALYELVKLEQARLDNLLLISFTCSGVFSLTTKPEEIEKKIPQYREKALIGENVPGIRETCTLCEQFIPVNADIFLQSAGHENDQKTLVFTKTTENESALHELGAPQSNIDLASLDTNSIQRSRTAQKDKVFKELKTEELGWNKLSTLFGRCINCHACSSVCPVCYCKLCYIDAGEKEIMPLSWEQRLRMRGSLRIPDSTNMYHLVRLLHVGLMCVGCGMCSDVCPVNIPIATIFTKFGHRVQKDMHYTPGEDITHKMPLTDVNPQDFVEISHDTPAHE